MGRPLNRNFLNSLYMFDIRDWKKKAWFIFKEYSLDTEIAAMAR